MTRIEIATTIASGLLSGYYSDEKMLRRLNEDTEVECTMAEWIVKQSYAMADELIRQNPEKK
jgi:hypothetical protein